MVGRLVLSHRPPPQQFNRLDQCYTPCTHLLLAANTRRCRVELQHEPKAHQEQDASADARGRALASRAQQQPRQRYPHLQHSRSA